MLEEQRGRELSVNLKELLIENSSVADEKPSRMRKVSITILKSNLVRFFFACNMFLFYYRGARTGAGGRPCV